MRKLLSTTTLAAVLALGGAAFAQSTGQGATPGGVAGSGGTAGGGAAQAGTQGGATAGSPQAGPAAGQPPGQPSAGATGGIAGQLSGSGAAQPGSQAQTGAGQTGAGQTGAGQVGAGPATPGTGGTTTGQGTRGQGAEIPPRAGAAPGTSGQPPVGAQTSGVMTQEQVMTKLSMEGFGNVQNVTRDGNSFRARAMQNGRPVDVTVDAYTGTIRS